MNDGINYRDDTDDSPPYGKQVYQKGDLVHIDQMPPYMAHFHGDVDAIVIGSYWDQCNGSTNRDKHIFQVFVKGHGKHAWYPDSLFMPIARAQYDLLDEWEVDMKEKRK